MPGTRNQKLLWKKWVENLVPKTRLGQAMLIGLAVWFFNWTFSDSNTIFGSSFLKRGCDVLSVLALIPWLWFLVNGLLWGVQQMLWRLRWRLILTYCLIGVLPLALMLLLMGAAGYSMLLQSNSDLVSRQLDGYVEQSKAAAQAISRELSNENLNLLEVAQLRQRLQNRANTLSSVFPGLTLTVRGTAAQPFEISVSSIYGTSEQDHASVPKAAQIWNTTASMPEWMDHETEFHGLVFDEDAMGKLRVFARHVVKATTGTPFLLQMNYPVGAELSQHLSHITGLTVTPSQELLKMYRRPDGELAMEDATGAEFSFSPASGSLANARQAQRGRFEELFKAFPIFMPITDWPTGKRMQSNVLVMDFSFLGFDQSLKRFNQLGSGSLIGELLLTIVTALGGIFLVIGLTATISAFFLTRSITGTVHHLYEGTKRIEAGNLEHEIPTRGQDQLNALAASFNQMTRSVRELLRVSAEKQRLDQEMRIAAEVQARLFPRAIPPTTAFDMALGVCIPARSVSGDYYDFLDVVPGVIGVVVADVCGKGMSAALLMSNFQAHLRGQVQASRDIHQSWLSAAAMSAETLEAGVSFSSYSDPSAPPHAVQSLITRVNHQIKSSVLDASYITLFYAEFDERTLLLRYVNAGHNPPLLLRNHSNGHKAVERLDCGGMVLGLFAEAEYEEATVKLESGDLFVAFTDGLIEARNPRGDEFGEERLTSLLARCSSLPAAEIERHILQAVKDWTGGAEQEDDLTLIVLKVK